MYTIFCTVSFFKTFNNSYILYRYLRSASNRVTPLKKLKEFTVKNMEDDDTISNYEYKEMMKRVRQNDLDIEETFTKGEDIETVISESSKLYDVHLSEEKSHKSFIKKQLIARKYFRSEKETNLLTYAAKQQIRYLHNLDSSEWTPEVLAKSFPISLAGVKRLLKSNYEMHAPEKIKQHDNDVQKKWEILKSGKPSDSISLYTRILWNEGKLVRENYNGNPNLPNFVPPKIIEKKKVAVGEFSAIVQKYVECKSQKESISQNNQLEPSTTSELINLKHINSHSKDGNRTLNLIRKNSKFIIDNEEDFSPKSKQDDELEFPLRQFKENVINDSKFRKQKSHFDKQYQEWLKQQSEEKDHKNTKKMFNVAEHFSPILKYNKEEVEINRDKSKDNNLYIYDDKLGYMHPKGRSSKGKIKVSISSQKNNHLFKVGRCVYDEEGEFLYKLPN